MKWVNENSSVLGGPAFYDMNRSEQMEHMMKIANVMRKTPILVDGLLEGGYVKLYNFMDYIQGSVRNHQNDDPFSYPIH